MSSDKPTLLVVEDDDDSRSTLSALIEAGILTDKGHLLVDQLSEAEDKVDRIKLCLASLDKIEQHLTTKANS